MTEQQFTDAAAELRQLAFGHSRGVVGADEAEDIAQDTMLKLWGIHEDLPSVDSARRMAATIARHLSVDRLRRHRSVSLDSVKQEPTADGHQPPPDAALEDADNARWLRQRLRRLPASEVLVLRLRQQEGRSAEEIAAILGMSASSVPVLLSRARRKLLAEFKKRQR